MSEFKKFDIRTLEGKQAYKNIPEDKTITWVSKNEFMISDEEIDLNPYDYSMDEVYDSKEDDLI